MEQSIRMLVETRNMIITLIGWANNKDPITIIINFLLIRYIQKGGTYSDFELKYQQQISTIFFSTGYQFSKNKTRFDAFAV